MSSGSSSSAAQVLHDVAEAAEEFVDKMNSTEEDAEERTGEGETTEGGGNTLEERKKKLEQLRQRMVRVAFRYTRPAHGGRLDNFHRGLLRRQTAHLSSRKLRRRK